MGKGEAAAVMIPAERQHVPSRTFLRQASDPNMRDFNNRVMVNIRPLHRARLLPDPLPVRQHFRRNHVAARLALQGGANDGRAAGDHAEPQSMYAPVPG